MDKFDDLLEDLDQTDQIKHNLGFKSDAVTYAVFIGDHSGSMAEKIDPSKEDSPRKMDLALSNFNEQIATLKAEADEGMQVLTTIIEFDNEILVPHDNVPVEEIEKMDEYWTRGMTSLYDAIAVGISKVETSLNADERENKAALVIIETDGYENYSRDYKGEEGRKRLCAMIKELEDTGKWTFTFLGAGLDEKIAAEMGFSTGNTVTFAAGNIGDTVHAYACQSRGLKSFMADRKNGVMAKKDFYKDIGAAIVEEGDKGGA